MTGRVADPAPGHAPRPGRARDADSLAIAGLEPFSSCDWPGHLTATLFLQGCPWQCTYCHNVSIIDPRTPGQVPWSQIRSLLTARTGLLDGVVFSGGEPTRQAGLADAMRTVRDLGFGVALHTGGAYPRRLAELVGLVDWVGLDIKAPAHKYAQITQVARSAVPAFESLHLLLDAGVDVQVRTTVDPTVLTPEDVAEVTEHVRALGVRDVVVQEVRTDGASDEFVARLTQHRRGTATPG